MDPPFVTILAAEVMAPASPFARSDARTDASLRQGREIVRDVAVRTGGRHVGSAEGLAFAFGSAVGAVQGAVEVQRATTGTEDHANLRVGLDAGEPSPDGDDLYGSP